jgi:hypothetical protein
LRRRSLLLAVQGVAQHRFGSHPVAPRQVHAAKLIVQAAEAGIVLAQAFACERDCIVQEGRGFIVLALLAERRGQVAHAGRIARVPLAKLLAADRRSLPQHRLSTYVIPLLEEEQPDIVPS